MDFAQRLDAARERCPVAFPEAMIISSLRKGFAQAEVRVVATLTEYYSVLGEIRAAGCNGGGSVANKVSSELLRRLFDGQLDQQFTGLADSASRGSCRSMPHWPAKKHFLPFARRLRPMSASPDSMTQRASTVLSGI